MSISLESLLEEVSSEITEQEVASAQASTEESKKYPTERMVWRMYAADPVDPTE